MSGDDDLDDVMRRAVPPHVAEQLLAGPVASDDVPDDLGPVADLLGALRQPPADGELAGIDDAVAVFRGAALTSGPTIRRTHVRHKPVTVAGIAAIATLSLGAVAAAAAGRLPVVQDHDSIAVPAVTLVETSVPESSTSVVESTTSVPESTTSVVGSTTSVPESTTSVVGSTTSVPESTTSVPTDTSLPGTPVGPNAAGPAKFGLCTAYAASKSEGGKLDSVAFQNLAEAAEAAGQTIEEFCEDAVPGGDKAGGPPEGTPGATAPGHSDDDPDESTPDDTAPGADDAPPSEAPHPSGPPASTPGDTAPGRTGKGG